MLDAINANVAEAIPFNTFKEKINTVKQELSKNRHVEVWDKFIYSVIKDDEE